MLQKTFIYKQIEQKRYHPVTNSTIKGFIFVWANKIDFTMDVDNNTYNINTGFNILKSFKMRQRYFIRNFVRLRETG